MEQVGELAAIWRYPVKSLAAQPLESTPVHTDGIPGDRTSALFVERGHARIGKTFRGKEHNLLHTVTQAQQAVELAAARGAQVCVRAEAGTHYFDDSPISLIFDCWTHEVEAALNEPLDPRRWRPNLYARAAPGFAYAESQLVGRTLEIGSVVLRVRDTIRRCVTTTYDIETGAQNDDVLGYVARERNNVMGVYCAVDAAGALRVGDMLHLRQDSDPDR